MTEVKKAGTFARAEGGARRAFLHVGAGVVAFAVGSFLSNGMLTRLTEKDAPIDSPAVAIVAYWLLTRLWLVLVMPAFGWVAGRFLEVRPFTFAAVAVLAGEVFDDLITLGTSGVEFIFPTPIDAVIRVVTLILGIAVTLWVTTLGSRAGARAGAHAAASAAQRQAEYDEFVARAAGKNAVAPEPPPEPPAPKPPDP